ncbi:MAG: hypothetical protein ABW171_00275 [Steroidobacter sp.]
MASPAPDASSVVPKAVSLRPLSSRLAVVPRPRSAASLFLFAVAAMLGKALMSSQPRDVPSPAASHAVAAFYLGDASLEQPLVRPEASLSESAALLLPRLAVLTVAVSKQEELMPLRVSSHAAAVFYLDDVSLEQRWAWPEAL